MRVVELRSASDKLRPLQDKMQEYLDNGVRLGWLIDPQNQRVEIYRQGRDVEVLQSPGTLSAEDVLPGFILNLSSESNALLVASHLTSKEWANLDVLRLHQTLHRHHLLPVSVALLQLV